MRTLQALKRSVVTIAAMLAFVGISAAQEAKLGEIRLTGAWSRPSTAEVPRSAVYLKLENHGAQADRLVAASSPAAARVELHESFTEGGMMHMRKIEGIDVPPHGAAELKPGGLHIMLLAVKSPLQAGKAIPVTLRFQKGGEVTLTVPIKHGGAMDKDDAMGGSH